MAYLGSEQPSNSGNLVYREITLKQETSSKAGSLCTCFIFVGQLLNRCDQVELWNVLRPEDALRAIKITPQHEMINSALVPGISDTHNFPLNLSAWPTSVYRPSPLQPCSQPRT